MNSKYCSNSRRDKFKKFHFQFLFYYIAIVSENELLNRFCNLTVYFKSLINIYLILISTKNLCSQKCSVNLGQILFWKDLTETPLLATRTISILQFPQGVVRTSCRVLPAVSPLFITYHSIKWCQFEINTWERDSAFAFVFNLFERVYD